MTNFIKLSILIIITSLSFIACNDNVTVKEDSSTESNNSNDAGDKSNSKMNTMSTMSSNKSENSGTVQKVDATPFNAALDALSTQDKEEKLKNGPTNQGDAVDAYCPDCGSRCCSPCFAGASRECAVLKFENCSVCDHSSSGHYAVIHE